MVEMVLTTSTQVSAAVQEMDELADALGVPNAERCSILGLSASAYRAWNSGEIDAVVIAPPALIRRIGYALPLMRRMAANMPKAPIDRAQAAPRPMVN
jgi:hypothetical protein